MADGGVDPSPHPRGDYSLLRITQNPKRTCQEDGMKKGAYANRIESEIRPRLDAVPEGMFAVCVSFAIKANLAKESQRMHIAHPRTSSQGTSWL